MRSLPGPPWPLRPWHEAQFFRYNCCPAAIDSGVDGTCAATPVPVRHARRKAARFIDTSLLPVGPEITFDDREQKVRDGVVLFRVPYKRHRAAGALKHEHGIGGRKQLLLAAAGRTFDEQRVARSGYGPQAH